MKNHTQAAMTWLKNHMGESTKTAAGYCTTCGKSINARDRKAKRMHNAYHKAIGKGPNWA